MGVQQISSVQNPLIKDLVQLQEKSKARKLSNTFLIEGRREIELAVAGGYHIKTVLFCEVFVKLSDVLIVNQQPNYIAVSLEVYKKLAYRDTTEGVLAVAVCKNLSLDNLVLPANPLVVVMEAIEKPGNVGAILRTADAANVDAVLLADPKADLYNPNIVRSSVGCVFTNQIVSASTADIIAFLKKQQIKIFSATLQNATSYHKQNYIEPTALVVGTESTGLSQAWRDAASSNIMIPMQGQIDSMNVSVAAAILIFEAKRQRDFI